MSNNFSSLSNFIKVLENENELIRIKTKINTELEITEIADRISKLKNGGKALLFENNGTNFPLLINAYGSQKRMCLSLGVKNLEDIGIEIENMIKGINEPKSTIIDKLKLLPKLKEISSWLPKNVSGKAFCQENIIKNPDLNIFPILKCWPYDGGKFITLPMVHTKDPNTGIRNVGMYRMQIFEKDMSAMHWHKHKTGAKHYSEYKKTGKKMPVAVALGGDPVYAYCATAPMPENIDEYMLAGFIRKKKVELVRCITQDIEVPVDADIVIEGYIDTNEDLIWEGPFGDHTGFYSLEDWYPKFHVTCITYRNNAVYPATIVGIPPMEDAYIAKATERIFLPLIKTALVPEIIDMNIPEAGVAHNLTLVKIYKSYPGQAIKVANALWGAGQMMFNKILVVADESVKDIQSLKNFTKEVLSNFSPSNDIHFSKGPLDVLDHSSSKFAFGSKLMFDVTKKTSEEMTDNHNSKSNPSEPDFETLLSTFTNIKSVNKELITENIPVVFARIEKNFNTKILSNEINKKINLSAVKIFILTDYKADISDIFTLIWLVGNNIEPQRDCWIMENPVYNTSTLFIDATKKTKELDDFDRNWPNITIMDDETIQKIDKIWAELNIGEFIGSPSLKFKNLIFNNSATVK